MIKIEQMKKKVYNFMDWKDKKLFELGILNRHEYFNNNDKRELLKFTNAEIEEVYFNIIKVIESGFLQNDVEICPFCIVFDECEFCTYHDKCNKYNSTWSSFEGHIVDTIDNDLIFKYINRYFII